MHLECKVNTRWKDAGKIHRIYPTGRASKCVAKKLTTLLSEISCSHNGLILKKEEVNIRDKEALVCDAKVVTWISMTIL